MLRRGPVEVEERRKASLQKVQKMKEELKHEEARFHASLPFHAQRVLKDKHLLLWARLLEETAFPDKGVWDLMLGASLTGAPSKSPLYESKVILPTTARGFLLTF